jgi:prephenate dehydrogenase
MRPDVLGVVGLGAIGGSVAWQASRAGIRWVIGYSVLPAESAAAARAGAVTEVAPSARHVLERSDLVVLAAPASRNLELLGLTARYLRPGALCTDVTVAKAPIVAAGRAAGLGARFAGSHPLVNVERSGFAQAEPTRFRGAVVYVTPAGDEDRPVREIADFWETVLEAYPVVTDAVAHDALVAWTSLLPQTVAAALACAFGAEGPRGVTFGALARELTRPALAPVADVRDGLLLNREALLDAMEGLEDALGALRRALQDGDPRRVHAWLEMGAGWRRRLDS